MTAVLVLLLILVLLLAARLILIRHQLLELARRMEELSPDSNQRLTTFLRDRSVLSLCRQINGLMDRSQTAVQRSAETERHLKYTIACISHDIRTPLTGASGYMQLLEKSSDTQKRSDYIRIVRGKLADLEHLLDELFLYTRLIGDQLEITCQSIQLLPQLGDALAGFYEKFEFLGIEPELSFSDETVRILADPVQLRRVLRNLISNALSHGCGTLSIRQHGGTLIFSNQVNDPSRLQPERMFERFYREDNARRGTHAGLGLPIARELTERMGGTLTAELHEELLEITLRLQTSD